MEVRQYRIFKEVAETGSFTKAAANLYITQSAVSHAVRDLEERADDFLFLCVFLLDVLLFVCYLCLNWMEHY